MSAKFPWRRGGIIFGRQSMSGEEMKTIQSILPLFPNISTIKRVPPSLIRVFTVRKKNHWILSYLLSAQRRLGILGGCPGWSESSLGAQVILLVFSCCDLFYLQIFQVTPFDITILLWSCSVSRGLNRICSIFTISLYIFFLLRIAFLRLLRISMTMAASVPKGQIRQNFI